MAAAREPAKTSMGILFGLILFGFSLTGLAQPPTVSIYAGSALPADGAHASSVFIDSPLSIAPDGLGGIYLLSYDTWLSRGQNRLYRIAADGTVTHIAGSGTKRLWEEGGTVSAMAADWSGNLYLAEWRGRQVRMFSPDGTITIAASDGTGAVVSDAAGNFYFGQDLQVYKFTPTAGIETVAGTGVSGYTGDGGPATAARIFFYDLAVDPAGNIYLYDPNAYIRKVSRDGIITTIAGNGIRGFSGDGGPATSAQLGWGGGIAVDAIGNVYLAERSNHRIRKISADGRITTIAGNGSAGTSGDGGPATAASLLSPHDVAVDALGNVFILDQSICSGKWWNRVRQVTPNGFIKTVLGNDADLDHGVPATSVQLHPADSVSDTAGNLYIADAVNNRIRKVTPDGLIHTLAGTGRAGFSGDGGAAVMAELSWPTGIALDPAGNLYIADSGNSRIRRITPDGMITTIAGTGTPGSSGDGGLATNSEVGDFLCGIAVAPSGSVYVAECNIGYDVGGGIGNRFLCSPTEVLPTCPAHRIRRITADGIISTFAGNGTFGLSGDGGPAVAAQLNLLANAGYFASTIAVDSIGNLYIADLVNNRIRKVDKDGFIQTISYTSPIWAPEEEGGRISVAVDGLDNLYIADGSNRVRRMNTDGSLTTVAGNGQNGFPADGVAAMEAPLNDPYDIEVDRAGNIYVIDRNHRVLKVSTKRFITGYLDGVSHEGASLYLHGWACLTGNAESIAIHVYVGGPAGQGGSLIAGEVASQPNEPAVSNACHSAGSNHRFRILLPASVQRQFGNEPIYVHGISPIAELPNLTIANSGNVRIPAVGGP